MSRFGRTLHWWKRLVAFGLLGRPPIQPEDVPLWALTIPFRMWNTVCRYDGRSFEDMYAAKIHPVWRRLFPLRSLYLIFLFLWPLMALAHAVRRGTGAGTYWQGAMSRPELSMLHPESDYTEQEWAWSRPDYALSMLYACLYDREKPDFLRLDDKHYFMEKARAAGLPLPPTLSREEAQQAGGEFIVKDPTTDLGFGIALMDASELSDLEGDPIIQRRLRNHPVLRQIYPADAPLSTLRVTTMLDPDTGEVTISRCAIRMGRDGAIADNTMQGGIWANIDMKTGKIKPGVTKKDFNVQEGGHPVRHHRHPDSGKTFAGVKVPWWEEGRALAISAHQKLAPTAPTLGWDVALCEGAPVFLEVNVWTVVYDYEPPNDAFTPAARLIIAAMGRLLTQHPD